jgi:hypothetical protein
MLVLVANVVDEAAISHLQAYKLRTSGHINSEKCVSYVAWLCGLGDPM